MTAFDLNDLLSTADLDDVAERGELADLLDDAGREEEAALFRGGESLAVVNGVIQPLKVSLLEAIREAYYAGTGQWTGCDWTLDQFDTEEEEDEYCSQVEASAVSAEENAMAALAAAEAGFWRDARDYAKRAYSTEHEYGDAPTWGGLYWACEEAYNRL